MRELKKRSLAKTISWRIIVTSIALAITINLIKSTAYFLHERIWDRVKWGTSSE